MDILRCKICDSVAASVDVHDRQRYQWCAVCEYICLDDACFLQPDEEKSRYAFHMNTMENEGYVRMLNSFIEKAVMPHRSSIKTALDFGCGPGPVLAALLSARGITVDIYDIYFAPDPVYEMKTYDLITATEVFEHLKDPLRTVLLCRDHLLPDGVLAIQTLFHPCDTDAFSSWWYRRDETHVSFYTPRTCAVLADRLNLDIAFIDGTSICVFKKKKL